MCFVCWPFPLPLPQSVTGQWIGLPGCLHTMDDLAGRFYDEVAADRPVEAPQVALEAEEAAKHFSGPHHAPYAAANAKLYQRFMHLVLNRGLSWLDKERTRLGRLSTQNSISEDKRDEFVQRLYILASFAPQAYREPWAFAHEGAP